jgi:hypothetical protein
LEIDGYGNAEHFMEWDITAGNIGCSMEQRIENVGSISGQDVVVSFWAKADSGIDLEVVASQNYGSGGSSTVETSMGTVTLTTFWVRYSKTVTLPSVTGKTIGASDYLALKFQLPGSGIDTISIWGAQLEAGTVATTFKLKGAGPKSSELALCRRYYFRIQPNAADVVLGSGFNTTTLLSSIFTPFHVELRVVPTAIETSGVAADYKILHTTITTVCNAVPAHSTLSTTDGAVVVFSVAAGMTGGQGSFGATADTGGYLAWSAEL